MITTENILNVRCGCDFERMALTLFRRQAAQCPPYREYISLLGIAPESVNRTDEIPFMPISLFKSHDVWCGSGTPQIVFTSSTTGGGKPSRHPMSSTAHYEAVFTAIFRRFYGEPQRLSLYALLPSYLQRSGSSLVYMADALIRRCGSGGFYLDDCERLLGDMERDPKPKILLGVSYALWDLAERYPRTLRDTVIMETGGMKGYREEIPRAELHRILCSAFGCRSIHSEYGMAELTSQAYSCGEGIFLTPPWMRVAVRDVNDPFRLLPEGQRGGLNIIDLANIDSCAFIQTQDIGIVRAGGSFTIEGRIDRSEIRGCNLLVQ